MWIRHLIAVAALPFTVAVLIPIWLARRDDIRLSVAETPMMLLVQACGVASLAVGLTLFATSLRRFAVEGKGTLAPWDPPARLVLTGPYRYVRNPMISGVLFVLLAEALILRSRVHAEWFLVFLVVNAIYIPWLEEPMLVARFGEPYREYCRHVHRFWPRWHPWSQSGPGDSGGRLENDHADLPIREFWRRHRDNHESRRTTMAVAPAVLRASSGRHDVSIWPSADNHS